MPHHAYAGTGQPYPDIEKLKLGEPESFNKLYQQVFSELVLKASSQLEEKKEAAALVNHCFIKCWLRSGALTSINYVLAFLSTTIRNNCIACNNNNGFRSIHYTTIMETVLAEIVRGGLTRKELFSHIDTLSPAELNRARVIFGRLYGRRMPVTDIAREMDMKPEETANSLQIGCQVLHLILFIENI